MTGDDLTIVIPLWRRTSNIERVAASARAATPDVEIVWVVSYDDGPVLAALTETRPPGVLHIVDSRGGIHGDYARKINAGYEASTRPFIFTGADDLHFHPEWYSEARALMHTGPGLTVDLAGSVTPPTRVGVVGTVDLCNGRTMAGTHSTHSLVARWYADCCAVVDQPGAIYHEGYPHDYCDDELVQTAQARGAYAHAFDAVVEHLHPNVGKAPLDDVYMQPRPLVRHGRVLFGRRRRLWAP